jgi:hypothetical protein
LSPIECDLTSYMVVHWCTDSMGLQQYFKLQAYTTYMISLKTT